MCILPQLKESFNASEQQRQNNQEIDEEIDLSWCWRKGNEADVDEDKFVDISAENRGKSVH